MDFIQLTVCLVLFAAIQVQAISKEREREILRQLLTDCKDKEGGSDSDFERMVHEQLPEAQEGRCMLSCVYEVIGIYKQGKFSRENFLSIASIMTKHDPRLMENSAKVADECGIVDGERCDQAYKFTDCFHSGFKRDHVDIEIV